MVTVVMLVVLIVLIVAFVLVMVVVDRSKVLVDVGMIEGMHVYEGERMYVYVDVHVGVVEKSASVVHIVDEDVVGVIVIV